MKHLVVRCVGQNNVAVVHVGYRALPDEIHLAEIIPTADPLVQRRVNHEVLSVYENSELGDVVVVQPSTYAMAWDMEAVENLVVAYLNRRSEARVRLNAGWKTELVNSPDRV
ncbi:MAG: hypothetical protein K8L91_03330 [Anaerolineae bacterium]|nr:hypothetical protein [Anaerolineae bacterium]